MVELSNASVCCRGVVNHRARIAQSNVVLCRSGLGNIGGSCPVPSRAVSTSVWSGRNVSGACPSGHHAVLPANQPFQLTPQAASEIGAILNAGINLAAFPV